MRVGIKSSIISVKSWTDTQMYNADLCFVFIEVSMKIP